MRFAIVSTNVKHETQIKYHYRNYLLSYQIDRRLECPNRDIWSSTESIEFNSKILKFPNNINLSIIHFLQIHKIEILSKNLKYSFVTSIARNSAELLLLLLTPTIEAIQIHHQPIIYINQYQSSTIPDCNAWGSNGTPSISSNAKAYHQTNQFFKNYLFFKPAALLIDCCSEFLLLLLIECASSVSSKNVDRNPLSKTDYSFSLHKTKSKHYLMKISGNNDQLSLTKIKSSSKLFK